MSGGGPERRRGAGATPLLAALAAAAVLPGCVAAVVPVLAAVGAVGKSAVDGREGPVVAAASPVPGSVEPAPGAEEDGEVAELLSGGEMPAPRTAPAPPGRGRPALSALPAPTTADLGEGATSPYARLARYALAQQDERAAGGTVRSAVLAPGVSLASPRFTPCADRPLAVLIDLDADGAPLSAPLDPARSTATLATSFAELRRAGIEVLWLSDRPATTGTAVREALTRAGYWSEGDRLLLADGARKQERRWAAARDRCVVAVAGDRRGDMDELYDYLRRPEAAHLLEGRWNAGWFLAPPPLAQDKD